MIIHSLWYADGGLKIHPKWQIGVCFSKKSINIHYSLCVLAVCLTDYLLCLRHFTGEVSSRWAYIRGQHLCHLPHNRSSVGPECTAHSILAHLPNRVSLCSGAPGPQFPIQPQQQCQQLWRGRWRTHIRPPEPWACAHICPSPADEMHWRYPSHQSPWRRGGEGGPRHSSQASLSLQTLPKRVHQPRGPEDAHPLTHSALCVHHLWKGFLQAMAAARPHPHAHR